MQPNNDDYPLRADRYLLHVTVCLLKLPNLKEKKKV